MSNHDSILFPPYRESFKEEILRTEPLWWKQDKGIFQYVVVWNAAIDFAIKKCKTYLETSSTLRSKGVMYIRFGRWVVLNNLPLDTIRYADSHYSDAEFKIAQYRHIIKETLLAFNDITDVCFTPESISLCTEAALVEMERNPYDERNGLYQLKLLSDDDREVIKLLVWSEISRHAPEKKMSDLDELETIEAALVYLSKKMYLTSKTTFGFTNQITGDMENLFVACMNLCPSFSLSSIKKLISYYDRVRANWERSVFMLSRYQSRKSRMLYVDLEIKPLKEKYWKHIEKQLSIIQSIKRNFPSGEDVLKTAIVLGWEECLMMRDQNTILGIYSTTPETDTKQKEIHIFKEIVRAITPEYPRYAKQLSESLTEVIGELDNPDNVRSLVLDYYLQLKYSSRDNRYRNQNLP